MPPDAPAFPPAQPFLGDLLGDPGPPLLWYPAFLPPDEADRLFEQLRDQMPWEQRSINFGGRRVAVPRLVAWFGSEAYRYGGFTHPARPLPPLLAQLRAALTTRIEADLGAVPSFNSVLLNYYRDGQDSMAFHSDNEVQLGTEPVIASLSLGATRTFQFRAIASRRRLAGALTHGGLLVMHGRSQADWQHAVPKEACKGPRINLTFRHTAPLRSGPLRLPDPRASR